MQIRCINFSKSIENQFQQINFREFQHILPLTFDFDQTKKNYSFIHFSMFLVYIYLLFTCINCELVVVSGVYPDPDNAPRNFSSSNKPYFNLHQTPLLNRVVTARMYHHGFWVLKDKWGVTQTPYTVGDTLAKLKPTYVHGLLFKQPGSKVSDQEIAGFITVRKAVLASSPFCKFSIEIDAVDYFRNGVKSLLNLLGDIKNKSTVYPDFQIDAIHMDHWNQAYSNNTSIGDYLIQYMHEKMNMIVGGNTYGGSVPSMTDYIGVTTSNFEIHLESQGPFPAIGLITNSNPLDASSEACAFLNFTLFKKASTFNVISTGNERISIIRTLGLGAFYSFAWPVFAPLCPSQKA